MPPCRWPASSSWSGGPIRPGPRNAPCSPTWHGCAAGSARAPSCGWAPPTDSTWTPDQVDVSRFERHLAAGNTAAALAEWRGEPLAGVDAPGLGPALDRLTESRLAAVEADLDRRVENDAAAAVGAAHRADRPLPLPRGPVGVAHDRPYRTGRQADALDAYRRARRVLVEELGVEPGPRLRELEALVLGHDERLAVSGVAADPLRPTCCRSPQTALGPNRLVVVVAGSGGAADRAGPGDGRSARRADRPEAGDGDGPRRGRQDDARPRRRPRVLAGGRATHLVDLSVIEAERRRAPRRGSTRSTRRPQPMPRRSIRWTRSPPSWAAARAAGLDNCEHVIAGAAALTDTVSACCPQAQVLTTSREALDVVGERVVVVPPLDPSGSAVELFAERVGLAAEQLRHHRGRRRCG